MLKYIVQIAVILMIISSCVSNKKVVYLQDLNESKIKIDSLLSYNYPEYMLQVGDIIDVDVRTLDPSISEIFNTASSVASAQLVNSASDINYLNGFIVNYNGDIELPLVGFVKVEGLTLSRAQEKLKSDLSKYIKDSYVTIRMGGIRYSALGEFRSPGRYSVLQKNLSIFEAIANAGDLNAVANRKSVKLIRRYADGQRIHEIDLTDRDIIYSPYYYIQPNDQIYVEPLKVRVFGRNFGVEGFTTFAGILSIISSTVLIIFTLSQ